MKKERLIAFTDAVLAIIMTILVLELEKPSTPTLDGNCDRTFLHISYLSSGWGLFGLH